MCVFGNGFCVRFSDGMGVGGGVEFRQMHVWVSAGRSFCSKGHFCNSGSVNPSHALMCFHCTRQRNCLKLSSTSLLVVWAACRAPGTVPCNSPKFPHGCKGNRFPFFFGVGGGGHDWFFQFKWGRPFARSLRRRSGR